MATKQDILITPASGYLPIDALLAAGPDWNYLTSDGSTFRTTLYYSFDTGGTQYETAGLASFTADQQAAVRQLLASTAQVTGIWFADVAPAAAADLHFAMADIKNLDLGGICYADYYYTATAAGQLSSYTADAYIYLDTVHTADPAPVAGSWWYQALLHEVGHALGLKHPFEATTDNPVTLTAPYQDSTATTVMSYTQAEGYTASFGTFDLAAFNFLYGGDGLRGEWGVGTNGLYLTGSPLDDVFALPQGKVLLTDTGGSDTIMYQGQRAEYDIRPLQGGEWLEIRSNGVEHLVSTSIEQLAFADGVVTISDLSRLPGGLSFGTDGDDLLIGTQESDLIMGGGGNDTLAGYGGYNLLHGGEGLDTVVFNETMDEVRLTQSGGVWSAGSPCGTTTMISVERLQFNDGRIALDLGLDQTAGQAALLISAALGKEQAADAATTGLVIGLLDSGITLGQASDMIVQADWFLDLTGGTETGFVQTVLQHILGDDPSAALHNEYFGMLQTHGGSMDKAELFTYAALSEVNQQQVDLVGLQQSGLVYV